MLSDLVVHSNWFTPRLCDVSTEELIPPNISLSLEGAATDCHWIGSSGLFHARGSTGHHASQLSMLLQIR
jgi:hypothetical protein